MIRSIMFLVLITAVAGFLTISCKQDSGKDVEVDTEKAETTETTGDKDKVATSPEWEAADTEAQMSSIQIKRKKVMHEDLNNGIFIKVDTAGDTVNVYVGDKYHDLKKRDRKFSVQNLYAYYIAKNSEIKTLKVFDNRTGMQVIEVSSGGYKKIKK